MASIDKLNFMEINRLTSFLSFYIHSIDYDWNWDIIKSLPALNTSYWTEVTEEDKSMPEDPRKTKHSYFLRYLITDLQQICYATKLNEVLPDELLHYILPETVTFKYSDSEELGYSDAQIILDKIKGKMIGEQLASLIKSGSSQIEAEGDLLFDIVTRCILSIAQYINLIL